MVCRVKTHRVRAHALATEPRCAHLPGAALFHGGMEVEASLAESLELIVTLRISALAHLWMRHGGTCLLHFSAQTSN